MKFFFVCSHQIQNLIPLFIELDKVKNLKTKIIYWEKLSKKHFDNEFKKKIDFGINLYKGYKYIALSKKINSTSKIFTIKNKIKITLALLHFLRNNNFDVIVYHGYYFPNIIGAIYSKVIGKKTVIRSISYNIGKKNIFKIILRNIYYRFSNLFFDEFWSVCSLNKKFFLNFGANKNAIYNLPSSQISRQFLIEDKCKFEKNLNLIKKKNNLNLKKKFILFAGKFNKQKRPIFLIDSFIKANLEDKWNLIIVGGGGELHIEVVNYLKRKKFNNIKYLGFKKLNEIIELYSISEILVLPSDFGETHGNVLMEAIQFNCSLMVSDRVGLHPEVKHFKMGKVFKADSKTDFIKNLRLLTKNDKLRNSFKNNGLKYSKNILPTFTAREISKLLIKDK
jgi:glycosyltransferase involved in cell wall biosynthesis